MASGTRRSCTFWRHTLWRRNYWTRGKDKSCSLGCSTEAHISKEQPLPDKYDSVYPMLFRPWRQICADGSYWKSRPLTCHLIWPSVVKVDNSTTVCTHRSTWGRYCVLFYWSWWGIVSRHGEKYLCCSRCIPKQFLVLPHGGARHQVHYFVNCCQSGSSGLV